MSMLANGSNRDLFFLYQKASREELKVIYETHKIDKGKSINTLIEQILYDGSHGIGYLLWGSCNYLEIVQKVAAQMKIDKKIVQTHNMAEIEQAILDKTMNEVASKLSSEERKEVEKILKEASKKYQSNSSAVLGSSSVVTTLISTIGRQATNQIIRKIMAKIATRFAAREAAKRGVTVATTAIPVVNVIMWGWTAIDLAGPAYRKIVPTVINTALLRLQLEDK